MPTQQTNLSSETERAAGVALDRSIALARDTMDDASAVARPDALMAAPGDASSERDAAAPAAASTRSVLSLLNGYWRAFQQRLERQRLRTCLQNLSERELMDIGITLGEIEYIAAHRTIDGLRDSMIMMSRGVM